MCSPKEKEKEREGTCVKVDPFVFLLIQQRFREVLHEILRIEAVLLAFTVSPKPRIQQRQQQQASQGRTEKCDSVKVVRFAGCAAALITPLSRLSACLPVCLPACLL